MLIRAIDTAEVTDALQFGAYGILSKDSGNRRNEMVHGGERLHATQVLRYHRSGDADSPQIVAGQIHGGIAQGVAQALWEEAVHDEDGNLVTGSMVNYLVPSAAELPSYELGATSTPSPSNPLGAKGVGETGTIASTAAVMNAVIDALVPFGVTDLDMPATPERVWRALEEAKT